MTEIVMYGGVGWEIDAQGVLAALKDVEGDVTIRMNSGGGDAFEGVAIKNVLRSHPGHVTVIVEGLAASAASVIAVGGADRLIMRPGAELMIHDAWTFADGNAADLEKTAADLERTSQAMAEIYAEKAGTAPEVMRQMMRDETWFSAQEAVDAGLADAVEDGRVRAEPVVAAAGRGPRFAYAGRSHAPTPKILKEDDNVTLMHKVAAKLGVSGDGLTEEIVLAALDETLAEQANDTEEEAAEPVEDEQVETPIEPEQPEEEADEAAEDGTSDAEDVDADGGEDAASAEDPDAAEVVTLNKAVYEDLLERAGRVDEHDKAELVQRAAALIDNDGVKAGRLLGWQRDAWVERAVENFDATRASLLALSPGTVNVTERGVAGSAEDASEKKTQRRGRDAGLAPAPTV
ncbi:ATP-dependent protease ClpP protease subunit [Corynebacterium mucifaciens]